MKTAWSFWKVTEFDSDGCGAWSKENWSKENWSKENMLLQQYETSCRIRIHANPTANAPDLARRVPQCSAPKFPERAVDLSSVRMERVARIRAEIATGCYHVSSEALAQKLIVVMLSGRR